MRRKIAIGTLGLMVLLAAAVVGWSQEGTPQPANPPQGQRQWQGGGQGPWGAGPRHFAAGGPGQFGRFGEGRMGWRHGGEPLLRMADNPRMRQYLGLTDEQVGSLRKIGVDAEKSFVQAHADMELRRIELRELLRADNPNHDAIMAKLDEMNALRGKMAKERVETMLSARSVLTPEQRTKTKTFMEDRGFGGGPGRGRMMRRQGGMGQPPAPSAAPGGGTPIPQEPPVQ